MHFTDPNFPQILEQSWQMPVPGLDQGPVFSTKALGRRGQGWGSPWEKEFYLEKTFQHLCEALYDGKEAARV